MTGLRGGTTLARSSVLVEVFALVDFEVVFALFDADAGFLEVLVIRDREPLVFTFPAMITPSINLIGL